MASISVTNPFTSVGENLMDIGLGPNLQGAIVDPVASTLIHMNTVADPAREPSFTFFGNPNFFFQSFGLHVAVPNNDFA